MRRAGLPRQSSPLTPGQRRRRRHLDGERQQARSPAIREHPAVAIGRYQVSYLGLDGQRRYGPETFERKSDAKRFVALIEVQTYHGEWTDPELGKVELRDYAERWIAQRPGLRPRTSDLYLWLLRKHIAPTLGVVPLGKLSTATIGQWLSELLSSGGFRLRGRKGLPAAAGGAHHRRG